MEWKKEYTVYIRLHQKISLQFCFRFNKWYSLAFAISTVILSTSCFRNDKQLLDIPYHFFKTLRKFFRGKGNKKENY